MPTTKEKTNLKTSRKYFHETGEPMAPPYLIEAQITSYKWFIEKGLKELLEEVSPIISFNKDISLDFIDYYLDTPKYNEETSKKKNLSFEAPLRCKVKLASEKDKIKKEQEIYFGEFPLMTDRGTFIINGVERVVVSQLIKSPGIFFSVSSEKEDKRYFGAKLIPTRGAWLEVETEASGAIFVKIDKKRKVAVTSLLRAFGLGSDEKILELFSDSDTGNIKFIKETIKKDVAKTQGEGFIEVYKRIRPGDLATADNARQLIEGMFFKFDRYDLGKVGRHKINQRLDANLEDTVLNRVFQLSDLVLTIKEIIRLNNTLNAKGDDIDHLGNRRVRTVGELVQERFRLGFMRVERNIKDRMSTLDINTVTPSQLINTRPLIAVIREFFMSSQLCQFMDQVNPLAELEHKRRLSAMGPGGLTRERAGFEVRDVHRSHYGRVCPIQTPEGPNIGLVGHLALYGKINDYGFLETPYIKVKNGKVTDEIIYLDATQEEESIIAHASVPYDDNSKKFVQKEIQARIKGNPGITEAEKVNFMDISSNQAISVATSLIPFLEHDDAHRALMGSNMQRQAVTCISSQSPIIGTGLEKRTAIDSGHVVLAQKDGEVIEVDGSHIKIKNSDSKVENYDLYNFVRSNAATCMTQYPRVRKGQKIKKGDLLADGSGTENGEIALGQNLKVAFMSWGGCNFEDAIILSQRVVEDDRFSSIHIEDFSIDVRDTKLGPEVITRDIPNVGEEKLKDLDEDGIIRIGAEVRSGDILVGKITPKGESDLTAEERLLRSIFGEKARDVKDTSLYLQHGEQGKVVDVKIFSREQGDKLSSGVIKKIQVSVAQLRKIQVGDKLAGRHGNKGVISTILPMEDMPYLEDGSTVDIILNPLGVASRMNIGQILETHLGWAASKLGYKVACQSLAGVTEQQIKEELKKAGLPEDGKVQLFDGKTGKKFDNKSTVGITYILKLNHLVEDKIHMRSIGPYSLITQQPLGGKAQFGGQRFGEMEVWALEGHGAANTLQEVLTIKSDDVLGRSKAYESIIKGESIKSPHIPASFHVLVNELKALSLNVELVGAKQKEEKEENENDEDRENKQEKEEKTAIE
ncbi:MAG: DNA-directed RNA polymerase subunit beta [Patescibacteria group bacterium]|nr:DNA-directed RNA polymerase subunit beta [Patescibacteria group bacterium]